MSEDKKDENLISSNENEENIRIIHLVIFQMRTKMFLKIKRIKQKQIMKVKMRLPSIKLFTRKMEGYIYMYVKISIRGNLNQKTG
jgi:hypothetical protein